jgi:hypothetical protein
LAAATGVCVRADQPACVVMGAGARELDGADRFVRVSAAVDLGLAAAGQC